MIANNDNQKVTPKQKAQELMWIAMENASYYLGDDEVMTEKEKLQVADQLKKLEQRILNKYL